jgi:hypothetical protein
MNKYLIIFTFLCFSALAETVQTEGSYTYTGNMGDNEACDLAKKRAELKALEKVIGQTISSDEMENCSEVDGKTSCERNQFFLSSFNGEISNTITIGKPEVESQQIDNSDERIYICKIKIQTTVKKNIELLDPSFDFNVKLNEKNFREGENLKIDIELNKPLYLSIFQILPYEEKDYQVYKIFPNELEPNNLINPSSYSLPVNAKYEVYFPQVQNKNSIDEYLFFIASEKNITWLEKYDKIEEFKKSYIKQKGLKYRYKEYTIYK